MGRDASEGLSAAPSSQCITAAQTCRQVPASVGAMRSGKMQKPSLRYALLPDECTHLYPAPAGRRSPGEGKPVAPCCFCGRWGWVPQSGAHQTSQEANHLRVSGVAKQDAVTIQYLG